jgi:hypothetical protein
MAYNQAPSRSPLIDKSMKEALEKAWGGTAGTNSYCDWDKYILVALVLFA